MSRKTIEDKYKQDTLEFSGTTFFTKLESGTLPRAQQEEFIEAICRTHIRSPKILSFLYSLAPPAFDESLKHNLFEELGVSENGGVAHPELLRRVGRACGFDEKHWQRLSTRADERLRDMIMQPLLFGSLRDIGLNIMLEVIGFEWMLSRLSTRIGSALEKHMGISKENLEWFYHHSEVDIQHAEEGLDAIENFLSYYEIDEDTLETVLEITFRENIFIKHYFGEKALAESKGTFL